LRAKGIGKVVDYDDQRAEKYSLPLTSFLPHSFSFLFSISSFFYHSMKGFSIAKWKRLLAKFNKRAQSRAYETLMRNLLPQTS